VARALVTLLCLAAVVHAAGARALPPEERHAGLAEPVMDHINALRAEHGLAGVRPAPSLRLAALTHTRDQIRTGVFDHDSADGTEFADRVARFYGYDGFSSWSVGENLYYGPLSVKPKQVVRAWLVSPGHRRLLFDPQWRDIGIVALVGLNAPGEFGGRDVVVVTSDFGARVR
jgi:uncharacterized protein YkwD